MYLKTALKTITETQPPAKWKNQWRVNHLEDEYSGWVVTCEHCGAEEIITKGMIITDHCETHPTEADARIAAALEDTKAKGWDPGSLTYLGPVCVEC